MEQILLAYGLPKETVAAIMILYRNTKVKVRSPDGDTEYFDIVAGVLQGDTLAPYLFIICLDYVLRTSIDNNPEKMASFSWTNPIDRFSKRYPAYYIHITCTPTTHDDKYFHTDIWFYTSYITTIGCSIFSSFSSWCIMPPCHMQNLK